MLRSASTSATTATPGTVYSVEYSSVAFASDCLTAALTASTVDAIACTRCFACVDWVFDFVRSPPLAFASTASAPSPVVRTNAAIVFEGFASRSGCASLRSADDSPLGAAFAAPPTASPPHVRATAATPAVRTRVSRRCRVGVVGSV